MFFLLIIKRKGIYFESRFVVVYLILLLIYYSFQLFYLNDIAYSKRIFFVLATIICYSFISLYLGIDRTAKYYIMIITYMALFGMISFFLVLIFDLKPFFEYVNYDQRSGYFFGLTCTNTYINFSSFRYIRYSGFFDEPGAMSFWGIYALLMNKVFLKSKKYEYLLILSLCFTFSLAFYVQLLFYYAFFYFRFNKKSVLLIFLSLIFMYICYNSKHSSYSFLYELTFERLEITKNGTFVGDNRSFLMQESKKLFLDKPLTGYGITSISEINEIMHIGANIYYPLAMHGLIGFLFIFLYFMRFLTDSLLNINKCDSYKYAFIILLGLLQRPHMEYIFEIISIVILIRLVEKYSIRKDKCITTV
jgi:hypothetical protein